MLLLWSITALIYWQYDKIRLSIVGKLGSESEVAAYKRLLQIAYGSFIAGPFAGTALITSVPHLGLNSLSLTVAALILSLPAIGWTVWTICEYKMIRSAHGLMDKVDPKMSQQLAAQGKQKANANAAWVAGLWLAVPAKLGFFSGVLAYASGLLTFVAAILFIVRAYQYWKGMRQLNKSL